MILLGMGRGMRGGEYCTDTISTLFSFLRVLGMLLEEADHDGTDRVGPTESVIDRRERIELLQEIIGYGYLDVGSFHTPNIHEKPWKVN